MKTFNEKTYRPLPKAATIQSSPIDGLGLHASEYLYAGTVLGETHVLVHNRDRHEWVRTPLGGFMNHSQKPNCVLYECGAYLKMKINEDIKPGGELTLTYSMYDPCKNYVDAND